MFRFREVAVLEPQFLVIRLGVNRDVMHIDLDSTAMESLKNLFTGPVYNLRLDADHIKMKCRMCVWVLPGQNARKIGK